jgi:hypothetical protein
MSEWHYTQNGQPAAAPVSMAELKQLAASGRLKPTDMVWKDGMPNWTQAGSIPELFAAPGAPAPRGPAPAPAPVQRAPAPGAPMDVGYASAAPGAGSALIDPITDLKRGFSGDLFESPFGEAEKAALAPAGVTGDAGQRYQTWRRSVLWLAAAPAALGALLGAISEIVWMTGNMGIPLSALGVMAHLFRMIVLFLLPAGVVLGVLNWAKPKFSRMVVQGAWVLTWLLLLLYSLVPFGWMVGLPDIPRGGRGPSAAELSMGFGVIGTILSLLALAPYFLSIVPGVIRASIAVKTLVPESALPGWVLLGLAVPYSMATLLAAVPLFGQFSIIMSAVAILFLGAPLIYLLAASYLLRVGAAPADRKSLVMLQFAYLGASALAVIILVVSIVANAGASGIPWFQSFEALMEYLAFSLTTTVVAADCIAGLLVADWRGQQAFAKSPEAAGFEQRLTQLETAVGKVV